MNFNFVEFNFENLTTDVFFRGNAGRIQGKYYSHKNRSNPAVLILPPDPRYGGNLDNKILVEMAEVFARCGFTVLRINYRGIEKSEGVFTGKEDAIYDVSVALDWLQEQNPDASHFWIAGYSFGAYIAGNIMMRRPEIETFVLVSPLVNKYNFSFIAPCLASGAVIAGEKDDIVPIAEIEDLVLKMNESTLNITTLITIPEATHLYSNQISVFKTELENYINTTLAIRVSKPVRKKRRRRKKKDTII